MRRTWWLLGITTLFVVSRYVCAQNEIPKQINIQNRAGELPFSSSIGTSIEHVDLASGILSVNVPLWSVPGRGSNAQLALHWNSNLFQIGHRDNQSGGYDVWKIGAHKGWETNHGSWMSTGVMVTCPDTGFRQTFTTNFIYIDESGGNHQMAMKHSSNPLFSCGSPQVDSGEDLGGQGLSGAYSPRLLTLSNGTQISDGATASSYEDPNGNKWQYTYPSPSSSGVDTLGKTFYTGTTTYSTTTPPYPLQTLYTVYDSGGAPGTITVNWQPLTINTSFQAQQGVAEMINVPWYAVSSIILPNGQTYQFHYNDCVGQYCYGEISEIDLPEGGIITYTWGTDRNYRYTRRYVTSRTETIGGTSSTWTISLQPTLNTQNEVSTVTFPPIPQPSGSSLIAQSVFSTSQGIVTDAQIYSGSASGTPLREYSIVYDWDGDPTVDTAAGCSNPEGLLGQKMSMRPLRVISVLEDGTATKTEYDYETFNYTFYPYNCPDSRSKNPVTFRGTYGNVTAAREYAFGTPVGSRGNYTDVTAALIRTTTKTYLHSNPAYRTANIVNKVTSVTVTDNQSGLQAALTNYGYDTTSVTSTNNSAAQHDANRGTSFTLRGNLTSVGKWLTGSTYLTTTYGYDDLGNIRSMTDPQGNPPWTYSYADSFNDTHCPPVGGSGQAYVTQAANPAGQLFRFQYYACTGLRYSRQDQNDINNGLQTAYSYDFMGRVTRVTYPDGGQVTTSYNDTTPPVSVQITRLIDSALGVNLVATAVKDGLGRVAQTLINSDPDGIVYTDTAYDSVGAIHSVSNPYRSTSESTYGQTYSYHDVLGRKILDVPPDGTTSSNSVQTQYAGNTTTTIDQAGKRRKSQTDSLGRLIVVWEDPLGLNYETDYTYDVLDNLLTVNQKGGDSNPSNWRTRTFTYDPLSRLLTANNPESGIVNYTYDSNGNLLTKVSPAPNQTNPLVAQTISYCYDQLNRITGKQYSLRACPLDSPAASYFYDQTSYNGLTISNGIGRRTGMSDASGQTAWSFDPNGRTANERRTVSTITKATTYTYNLDGSPKTVIYPGTGDTLTYTVGGAGRATGAKDTAHSFNYVTNATYAPFSGLASFKNGASINVTDVYNSRLQPCWMYATTGTALPTSTPCTGTATTGTIQDIKYNFGLGTNDNGNVLQIVNNRDNNRTQNFTYDPLNRIAAAYTSGPNWGEDFTIDAWGNLTNRSLHPGKTNYELLNCAPGSVKNQLTTCAGYDAAGNMTSNGSAAYTYDAENRLVSTAGYTYVYDGDGNRVKKSSGSTGRLYWLGTGSDSLNETDLAGSTLEEYIFFNGKRVARYSPPSGAVRYFFSDHLGSHSVITSSAGAIQRDYDYYPYGGEIPVVPGLSEAHKFTGKERDSESGLDNFGKRYNASSLGRFMTPDSPSYSNSKNPQSWNLYAFALNNPVTFRDADGHEIVCANNAEQCKKDAAAAAANAEAAKRVTTNTVTTKHSFLGIKWATTKTTIAITGDIKSFRALGQNASRLADLVTDKRTITVEYDQYAKPSFWANGIRLNGGATSYAPSQGYDAQAFIDPSRTGAVYDPDAIAQGIPQANTAEEFGHEVLGHIWGEMSGGHQAGTRANMRDSITGENAVRKLDPTRGQKGLESHHNYNEMPPD